VAAPAFAQMMEFTLRHYRVAPTGTKPPKLRVYP
jgi:cell division protein FtsI (penicillin-binding protein 3)